MDITSFSLPFLLAVLAIAPVAYILVSRRKKRQAQETDIRRKAELEAWRAAEEDKHRQSELVLRRIEETLRRAEEVRREEEERQRLEESTRREAEEANRAAQEEANRKEGEEVLRKAQEAESEQAEPGVERPAPLKRGGRPRAPAKAREKQAPEDTHHRRPKPEIVCWKREREWIPGVEIPDELLSDSAPEVWQNSLLLTQDESNEALWRLVDVRGQVVVRWNEDHDEPEASLSLEKEYMIFRLGGQTQNQGHRVRLPSSGTYLVIAPRDWERDEALSGSPQWAPEAVSLSGYRAHYYSLPRNAGGKIAFHTSFGEHVVIESEAPRFELVGTLLQDASDDAVPLYGGNLPRIRASGERGWMGVGAIVVGEEGGGPRRWRTQFNPALELIEQEMPPQVAARGGGWYFLRFYDWNDDFLESLDFRFLSALKGIQILQQSPLPPEDGHTSVLVEMLFEPTLSIQASDERASKIPVERENGKMILRIPPDPSFDETRWLMGFEGGPQLEVAILVERLWWAVCNEDVPPSKWEDMLFVFSREDFSATSRTALWIKLPRRRWVGKVFVGFMQSKARSYAVKVAEREIAIPLREFCDSQELEHEGQRQVLKLWVSDSGEIAVGAVLATGQCWTGHGRHKTAIARAELREGTGEIKINGQSVETYFSRTPRKGIRFLRRLLLLSEVADLLARKDTLIVVRGGNETSVRQARAVAHALARALMACDFDLRPRLRRAGFGGVTVSRLTRVR